MFTASFDYSRHSSTSWCLRIQLIKILFLICALRGAAANNEWKLESLHAAFSPRDSATVVNHQGKLYLSNGYYHGNIDLRDLYVSDDGLNWRKVHGSTPYDRYSTLVSLNGRLLAISDTVWVSTNGTKWHLLAEELPWSRSRLGILRKTVLFLLKSIPKRKGYYLAERFAIVPPEIVTFNNAVYAIGGDQKKVWRSEDGLRWQEIVDNLPFGVLYKPKVLVLKNSIYLLGGWRLRGILENAELGYEDYITINEVWISNDGANWKRLKNKAAWSPRMWPALCVVSEKIYLAGGYSNVFNKNLNDCWISDNGTDWERVETGWAARHAAAMIGYKDRVWLLGGNTWPVCNEIWSMNARN